MQVADQVAVFVRVRENSSVLAARQAGWHNAAHGSILPSN